MKRISLGVLLVLFSLISVPALTEAKTVLRSGESVSISDDQKVAGNFYGLSDTISLAGEVDGDVLLLGGTVVVNGVVADDVLVIGGNVTVSGKVAGDVRVLAGNVTLTGEIGGSVAVVTGKLDILSGAKVSGDVLVYGGNLNVSGEVTGQVLGSIGSVRVDGPVEGGIDIETNDLTLGDKAQIGGDVRYVGNNDLVRSQNATVSGEVVKSDPVVKVSTSSATDFLLPLLISLFATLSFYLLLRRPLEAVVSTTYRDTGKAVLVGFGGLLLIPIAVIVLLVSVLGIFVGAALLLLYGLLLIFALVASSMVMGALVAKMVVREYQVNIWWIMLGAMLLHTLFAIHWITQLAGIFIFLATTGGLLLHVWYRFRRII